MNSIVNAAVSRSRAVVMLFTLILVMGSFAYLNIPKESDPDVQIPIIYTVMTHEGISPEDAERMLIRPMEKELQGIEGVKEMRSSASQGRASVTLEFDAGFDSDKALLDVREKVDIAKAELPEETDEPTVNEVNLSLFPVINVILRGTMPERSMLKIARNLRDSIEEIPAVLEVDIAGEREETLDVILDPTKVQGYNLTTSIIELVRSNNLLVAAGSLDTGDGRYDVKVPGVLETVNDIMTVPLKVDGDAALALEDVGIVRRGFKDHTSFARVNGEQALVLEVSKRTGENIIDTIKKVRAVVEQERKFWPEGIDVLYAQDQSERITDMLGDLQSNLILAIILVAVIIIAYVGIVAGGFIAIAIPGAFLIGILFLYFAGFTMNIVVLFSLILSIGMLVDSAIVVIEYANRRMIDGARAKEAFAEGAKRMGWPIVASTITTLIAFAPLLFWPGIPGQFMQYMPITLMVTLTGSLVMALIILPSLGNMLGMADRVSTREWEVIHQTESGDLEHITGFTGGYIRTLRSLMKRAWLFVLACIAALVGVIVLYGHYGNGVEFFPKIEPEQGQVIIRARGNLSVWQKRDIAIEVEDKIKDLYGEITVFYTRTGEIISKGRNLPEDTIAIVQLEFADWQKRRHANDILAEVRERLQGIPGIAMEIREDRAGPQSEKPIEIEIASRLPDLLEPTTHALMAHLDTVDGLVDVDNSLPVPAIEWQYEVDRAQASKYGVNIAMLGQFMRLATNGMLVTTYRPDDNDDEVDVLARYPKDKRSLSYLDNVMIGTAQGPVPIGNFVKRKAAPKLATISRVDGLRVVKVSADVADGVLADNKVKEILAWLEEQRGSFDPNVRVRFKGEEEDKRETSAFLRNAFILALFGMALVMVTQFNSFFHAFVILSAVFLSTAGVLLGLLITGQPFGIVMCGVGIISLAGIVVNNNIIFIDTYQILRREGMGPHEALLRTGGQRLRPILLTAGTTVLGLLPMVFGVNIDFVERAVYFDAPSSQWWRQLSTTIASGLSFATILTLLFTPCLIWMVEKRKD